jgi:hypothetical protein
VLPSGRQGKPDIERAFQALQDQYQWASEFKINGIRSEDTYKFATRMMLLVFMIGAVGVLSRIVRISLAGRTFSGEHKLPVFQSRIEATRNFIQVDKMAALLASVQPTWVPVI